MAVNLSPVGGVAGQFFDNNGNPLTGGKLYTYAAGTTTPQATYTSAAGVIAHSNPIILNAGGRVPNEIWLTDGLEYKFALYDANNVLIGTWDDIIGINSNFVNFVSSEEVQIATAGQTVFTLTTMQYQPGTNNLVVYVDGVNQVEGGSYSFVETDATTVTFTAGLHVGAVVKFVSAEVLSTNVTSASTTTFTGFNSQVGVVQDIADADGSDWIGFEPAGTGAVARSVESKLRETVSVKDFGAVGDGVADDTVAIQTAIDSSTLPFGKTVHFPPGNYKITASLNITKIVALVGSPGSVQIVQFTPDTNHITIGDGTLPVREATFNTLISGITFAPGQGVTASTSGACIKANYVAFLRIYDCRFFGADTIANKLWNGIELSRVEDSWFYNIRVANFVNNAIKTYGQSGLANRTIDVVFTQIRTVSCGGDHINFGPYTEGIFLNNWIALGVASNTSGLYIEANPVTEQGLNYFIVNPNIEGGNNANSYGIYVKEGQAADISGGWIGGFTPNNALPVWFAQLANSCSIKNTRLDSPGLRIDAPACTVANVEITGDALTTETGIYIGATADGTNISGGRIRQLITSGIDITGTPADVLIEGVVFTSIVGDNYIVGETYITGPIVKAIKSSVLINITAAATITVNYGREFYSVTGGTTISNISLLAPNSVITIQAGVGGVTFDNAGNIVLKGAVASANIAAFSATMFVCDGANWFQI